MGGTASGSLAERRVARSPGDARRALVLTILAAALVIRLWGIGAEPFWLDEVCSGEYSTGRIEAILEKNAGDIHPPGYYLGLASWRHLAGDSEAMLRGYSTAWSVMGVGVVMLLGWELAGPVASLTAGVTLALVPLDVFYAQEARMYAQLAALSSLGAWLLLCWMNTGSEHLRRRLLLASAWAFTCLAVLYTHYLGAILVATQGLLGLAGAARRRSKADIALLASSAAFCAAAFMPWIVLVHRFRSTLYSEFRVGWIPRPTIADATTEVTRRLFAGFGPSTPVLATWFAAMASLVILLAMWTWTRVTAGATVTATRVHPVPTSAWLFLAPLVVAFVVSLAWKPVYFPPRFVELIAPAFAVLLGVVLGSMPRWPAIVLGATVLATLSVGVVRQQTAGPRKAGMKAFAEVWRRQGPADAVAFFPFYQDRVAAYELGAPLPIATRASVESLLREERELTIWIFVERGYRERASPAEWSDASWLLSLGEFRSLGETRDGEVIAITVTARPALFPTYSLGSRLRFGESEVEQYLREGWYSGEKTFRWAKGDRSRLAFGLAQVPLHASILIDSFCYRPQSIELLLNGRSLASFECTAGSTAPRELPLPAGVLAQQNNVELRHPGGVSPRERGESDDGRRLSLAVRWLEIR